MQKEKTFTHPYIPNTAPEIRNYMVKEIGIKDVEEIYQEIPQHLRLKDKLNLQLTLFLNL